MSAQMRCCRHAFQHAVQRWFGKPLFLVRLSAIYPLDSTCRCGCMGLSRLKEWGDLLITVRPKPTGITPCTKSY